jgi:pimeloyl-ACP methyl ester carboxylesterase
MNRRRLIRAGAGFAPLLLLAARDGRAQGARAGDDPRVRHAYLDSPNGQIHYWTAGRGPNLVLIHQSANSSDEYAGLVPHLADRFRMVAVDLPGHGRSDDPPREPTVDDYSRAVQRVLDHLRIRRAHLVGHHGGALTAMDLAAKEPERFEKTILSGTGGVRTTAENDAFIASLTGNDDRSIRPKTDWIAATWQSYMDMMSEGADPADMLRPFLATLEGRLRPYRGVLVNLKWDRRPALAKLRGPVLLVKGERDRYVSGTETLLDMIPRSRLIVMAGCGTFMFYDRSTDCAAMIRDYLTP